jgi:putative endonuclease
MVHRIPFEERVYAVYLLASKPYGTRYIGVTGNLLSRITEHRNGTVEGFTKTYKVGRLVWYETFHDMGLAIQREKTMKKWPRQWKINLIERHNPHWEDLYSRLL